jgi:DNA polymerase/3'-5' exonuclease PolX
MKEPIMKKPSNNEIADILDRIADLLDVQDANPFRVRAYREGANSVRYHDEPIADLVRENRMEDLKALPSIGEGIAAVIAEYVSAGQSNLLKELEAEAGPEGVFVQVPGIGKELAERIAEKIHVRTLPELEEAAHGNGGRLWRTPCEGGSNRAGRDAEPVCAFETSQRQWQGQR